MAGINLGRVVLGGIAAAGVHLVFEIVGNGLVFAEQSARMQARFDLEPALTPLQIGMFFVIAIGGGTGVALTYAMIRPRFGPGPSTGIAAGMVAWMFGTLFVTGTWVISGLLPVGFGVVLLIFQAVKFGTMGLVAGLLYREEQAAPA